MINNPTEYWYRKNSPNIYGAIWDGTERTDWTRTDKAANFEDPIPAVNNGDGSSPFDNLYPWRGMTVVDDVTAGKLVMIPKYWYKWTRSGITMKLQISDRPADGFFVSPAHADRGDGNGERNVVYVGRYHCNSIYKSRAGSLPIANITRDTARTNIHNLGSTYWQYDFAMYWTIMMLYLVEYANWNSQEVIGYGNSSINSKVNSGATDAMIYHTGTSAESRTSFGCVQYRHIEGLWDNVYDYCDGIYFYDSNVYCIKNPENFSDTENGTLVGMRDTSGGYISAWSNPTSGGFEYALFPSEFDGTDTTYVCDYFFTHSSGQVLFVGGGYLNFQSSYQGAFCMSSAHNASTSNSDLGCRLMKLP